MTETKTCQNCKNQFTIEPEDFVFYEKLKVPAPTWCPECRLTRRLSFMSGVALHNNTCGFCGKKMLSQTYSNIDPVVYCNACWWSDKWDALSYGAELDFSRPVLEQFFALMKQIPWYALATIESTMVGSEYCNNASYLKNCYLLYQSDYSENCFYGTYTEHSRDSLELLAADHCELCYEGVNLNRCQSTIFSRDCESCHNVYFSKDLVNCSNCFGCVNLRNKQYCVFNKQCAKEEYLRKLSEFNVGSHCSILEIESKVADFYKRYPHKFMHSRQNFNVSGDYIYNSKNTFKSYQVVEAEDSKFCHFLILGPTRDSYDLTMWGGNATRAYECMGAGGGQNDVKFGYDYWSAATLDIQYCMRIVAPNSHLFACIGLRHKQYCILNKQYSKEKYEELVPRIIAHMNEQPYIDSKGRVYRYGEFFPPELSPFAYNETIAQEYFPLTKDQALAQGYRWRDPEARNYQITISNSQLPDHIKDVSDSITNEIIQCAHAAFSTDTDKLTTICTEQCTTAFKIIPQELQFYRRMNLPLPRLCPNCRHYKRLKQRNPLKLWERQCMCGGGQSYHPVPSDNRQLTTDNSYANTASHAHGTNPCPNTFKTSYAPDRPEIVYCEACYNAEVV